MGATRGNALLQLEQQRRVLDLDQVADLLQPSLHERQSLLHDVVPVGDVLLSERFRRPETHAVHELDELVLHVLNEVQPGLRVIVQAEDGQIDVGRLDTCIQHLGQNRGVVRQVDHQLSEQKQLLD